jgi:dTDP-4-amino-4,6-dideoxygalactose transaminase
VNHVLDNYADTWIKQRRETLDYFSAKLDNIPHIKAPVIKQYVSSMGAFYGYKPKIDFRKLGVFRDDFIQECQLNGMDIDVPGSKPFYYYDLFKMPGRYLSYHHPTNIDDTFSGAEEYYQNIVSFPTFTFPKDREIIDLYIGKLSTIINKYLMR